MLMCTAGSRTCDCIRPRAALRCCVQDAISRIEEQLGMYKRSMESALLEAASVRSHVQALTLNEAAARDEAKAAREELKKLRKEHIKLKDEAEAEAAAHAKLRALHSEVVENFRRELDEASRAAATAEAEAFEVGSRLRVLA